MSAAAPIVTILAFFLAPPRYIKTIQAVLSVYCISNLSTSSDTQLRVTATNSQVEIRIQNVALVNLAVLHVVGS